MQCPNPTGPQETKNTLGASADSSTEADESLWWFSCSSPHSTDSLKRDKLKVLFAFHLALVLVLARTLLQMDGTRSSATLERVGFPAWKKIESSESTGGAPHRLIRKQNDDP